MKKLFEVEVTTTVYVWAEDRLEAERLGEYHIGDEMCHDTTTREVTPGSHVDSDWADSFPYGDAPEEFDSLTAKEVLDKLNTPDADAFVPDPYTLPLPGV
jgi:hypothetical protein